MKAVREKERKDGCFLARTVRKIQRNKTRKRQIGMMEKVSGTFSINNLGIKDLVLKSVPNPVSKEIVLMEWIKEYFVDQLIKEKRKSEKAVI